MVEMPDVGVKVLVEVESHNGKAKFEGIVLHPAADGYLTLKLANGYNASYPANDILSVEILEAPQNSDIQQSNDFEFDEKVVSVFDDMVSRSVPYYNETRTTALSLAKKFVQKKFS